MSKSEAINRVTHLKNRYLLFRFIEIVLLAVASVLFAWMVSSLFSNSLQLKLSISLSLVLLITTWRIVHLQLYRFNNTLFVQYLNSHYIILEESADLLLKEDASLSELQQLQLQKTIQRFGALYPTIKIPNSIPQTTGILIISFIGYVILGSFAPIYSGSQTEKSIVDLYKLNAKVESGAAIISFLSIKVSPPVYTNLSAFESTTSNLKVPEGSHVKWNIHFSDSILFAHILLSGKDSIDFTLNKGNYQSNIQVSEPGFYQIQWQDAKLHISEYFKIEVIKDESPKISIADLNQFTRLSFANQLQVSLKANLSDDYGLTNAVIIATVSKGSGESVKFREEKIRFETPSVIAGKQVKATRNLNLNKLGMEPGDELYFYVEAWDNKTPIPNYSRTETFLIALQDTTKEVAVDDDGLGVDLMPEYFRSQRQIIIDTEKLLREKKIRSVQEFKSTSNELGYDQKVLRLRYGQFLGEEFEDQIGKAIIPEDNDESTEDVAKKFGHAHDKENEHNLVADKKSASPSHSKEGNVKDSRENETPLEAFAHEHDNGEEATFFVQSVRAKLKAALTVMWDAELYLRLYEPSKSLPYQYTALKLLKEISNDSRIYVHRTGFDPPPLKEEKRLTGDLTEIKNSATDNSLIEQKRFLEIRKALIILEHLLDQRPNTLSSEAKKQLHMAGLELAVVVLAEPGKYLEGLSLIRKITEDEMDERKMYELLLVIRSILWSVLPIESSSPSKSDLILHSLDQQFLKNLEELSHE